MKKDEVVARIKVRKADPALRRQALARWLRRWAYRIEHPRPDYAATVTATYYR